MDKISNRGVKDLPFTREEHDDLVIKFCDMLEKAGIVITEEEKKAVSISDFNLNMFPTIGLEVLEYINTDRYCAKELVLFPNQICPEHRHPEVDGRKGKQETFRCRWGEVYLYVPGEKTKNAKGKVPPSKENTFRVWHEIVLKPGEQYTIPSDTLHWFQGGPEGAIVSEFSSTSSDENDIFTDEEIIRHPKFLD
ncbi:MAG: D-lyxose/D-mannose family sugar isomerase [Candidatus Hodarchaeota archaeon]